LDLNTNDSMGLWVVTTVAWTRLFGSESPSSQVNVTFVLLRSTPVKKGWMADPSSPVSLAAIDIESGPHSVLLGGASAPWTLAMRAACRAALCTRCSFRLAIDSSNIPKVMIRNAKIEIAVSTIAAPRRRLPAAMRDAGAPGLDTRNRLMRRAALIECL